MCIGSPLAMMLTMKTSIDTQVHYRACNLCEAICGLRIETRGSEILSIRGDADDPFSRGYICPKAVALQDIQDDPDRLRAPLVRRNGVFVSVDWDEALDAAAEGLFEAQRHGSDAVAVYAGNPSVHNHGTMTHQRGLLGLLRTRNRYSATSVDQLSHHVVGHAMFGHQSLVPIPDIDHTDFLLMLGANPLASNGSMMTAPGMRHRIKALQKRGGELVVVDPRRTETAQVADDHLFIRPGTDAAMLAALLNVIFDTQQDDPGRLRSHLAGYDTLASVFAPFTPEWAATSTGIEASAIRALASRLVAARTAAVYGRMGVSTQLFGGLCQWMIQLLNIATGNFDKKGGVLFTRPAVDPVGQGLVGDGRPGKWKSRVSGRPSFASELPAAVMTEEMTTPGDGQIKALVTVAGNPVLSTPNGAALEQALAGLEFMVSLDIYQNETTRYADVILPPTSPLEHDHYDYAFNALAVRNVARYNAPVFPKPPGALHDWEIFNGLASRLAALKGVPNQDTPEPARLLNLGLAFGPYGRKRRHPRKLTLRKLTESPHGVDLGPLEPSLPARLQTADGKVACVPAAFVADLQRLSSELRDEPDVDALWLIGRRDVRSNNSWMHNSERLVKGKPRCDLLMNPSDLSARKLQDGDAVTVRSRVGASTVVVRASDTVMPGVVSLPHGWGHDRPGIVLSVAQAHPGVSVNDLTDEKRLDELTGTAAVNGVPVSVSAA